MTGNDDNPYAAPQAPPEKRPPVPLPVHLRAGLAGITAFVIIFVLAVAFSVSVFVVASDWHGPQLLSAANLDAGHAVHVGDSIPPRPARVPPAVCCTW